MASELITHKGDLHGLPPLLLLSFEILHELATHGSLGYLEVSTHRRRRDN